MAMYLKVGTEWVETTRPFVKIDGAWVPAQGVYVKSSGEWETAYAYDQTPPPAPQLSLELVEMTVDNAGSVQRGRHIKVGARVGSTHDSDVKRIRVLTTYNNAAPSTQYGGTFTSTPQSTYPDEPWSDFFFNGHSGSSLTDDTSVYRYKTWTPNATAYTQLDGDKTYHFAAWAEDNNGNWSAGTFSSIYVPKQGGGGSTPGVLAREERFRAVNSGSHRPNPGYASGQVIQSNNPRSRGMYFYADSIRSKVGKEGTPKIKSAQIYCVRANDTGKPRADLWLFWHEYGNPGQIGADINTNNITHIGRITKGENKWLDLPAEIIEQIEARNVKGFGFNWKSPSASVTENDFSVLKAVDDKPRAGEVHIVWEETL